MSQKPYVQLSFEQQQAMERGIFDAMDSLCQCLGYGLILGWGMQSIPVKAGLITQNMPGITLTFPPTALTDEEKAEGKKLGPVRHVNFAVGQHAPNVPMLFAVVGGHAHQLIEHYHKDGGDVSDYMTRRLDMVKTRDEKRKRIVIPNGN